MSTEAQTTALAGLARWHWVVLALAGIAFGAVLHMSGAVHSVDLAYIDAWHRQAAVRKEPKHVALVVIDDKALLQYRDDPVAFWTQHYAKAVAVLREAGVAVVGFDMIFGVSPEAWIRRFAANPDTARTWDAPFRRELNSGKVVLASGRVSNSNDASGMHSFFLPHEDYLFALPDLDFESYVGLANLDESDRVVRGFVTTLDLRLKPEEKNASLPRLTFPTLLAVRAAGADPKATQWTLGGRVVERSTVSQPLFYAGPPGTVPRIPLSTLLAPDAAKNEVVAKLRGKVIIIGGDWGSDVHATPYSSSLTGQPAQFMLGAEIHANAVETLLSGERNHSASEVEIGSLIALGVMLAVLLFRGLPLRWALAGVALAWITLHAISYLVFKLHQLLPIAAAQFAMLATAAVALLLYVFSESRERKRIRELFGRYVSDAAVTRLVQQGAEPNLGGESTPVTMLFSDIRDFTQISEILGAKATVELLNNYLEGAADAVLSEGGSIDKFIGDTVMAEFGTPEHHPMHARAALRAALKLKRHAQTFAERYKKHYTQPGLPAFRIGVGVHTGEAIVGSIGTRRRSEFTVIGDVVNVAARVEGLTKDLGVTVLATRECIAAAGTGVVADDKGTHAVKGRSKLVHVFALQSLEDYL